MKGVFKCAREDDKKIQECQALKLGDAPMHPQQIFKETQASKLGDAPVHPLLHQEIISSPFVSLYFYHFMRYVLCLERLALRFYFSLALLSVHNKLDPVLLYVGDKHAPLSKSRTHYRILHAYLFAVVCSLSFRSYCHV